MTTTRHHLQALVLGAALAGLMTGCPDEDEPALEVAEGIFAPLGEVLPSATTDQKATFARGLEVMSKRFTPEEGLGPQFNVSFCGACHERPTPGGGAPRYRNFLLVHDELADGSTVALGVNGVLSQFALEGAPRRATPEGADRFATRNGIPFFGVGLLAEVHEDAILANADPDDANGDGISGRPNYDRGFVGRFGRKAQTVSIEGFIRGPLFNHMGITSDPLSNARKAALPVPSDLPEGFSETSDVTGGLTVFQAGQAAAPDEPTVDTDGVADPELSEQDLFDLVSFAMLLAAPTPDEATAASEAGRDLFHQVGCASCHVPTLASPRGLIPAYTDLLLHAMGPDLADGFSMGLARGDEFRTQPLWGVAGVAPYLHDGRADTLDDAIRWHGGEAEASRDAYLALSAADRASVITFVESLGGRTEHSSGLLPPGAPVPDSGAAGGPSRPLDAAELKRFEAGREVFDRDQPSTAGLGPRFNGDSCRACHFDPVIGGAGPIDLNVSRHGLVDEGTGVFSAPAQGTMAHRHGVFVDARPPVDAQANVFETRQPPSTLGLGLIEQISKETILALADPSDADSDGIRGVAQVLPDGRVGRLGWKAGVPSVEEFLRDAMSNELGLTMPARDGQTFGFLTDDDATADPELTDDDYANLLFYMQMLGPPPTKPGFDEAAATGGPVFERIGCASCHVASLPTADGVPVPLYSDLLLHDVLPDNAWGIADGAAGMRSFRTAPLWGISDTAPYMHDGRATTLEASIEAHAGEAAASRDAFVALDATDRQALLDFLGKL